MTTTTAAQRVAALVTARRRMPPPEVRRALREAAGISAAQVAAELGVTRQALSRWERGEREPSGSLARAYLSVLDALAELDDQYGEIR